MSKYVLVYSGGAMNETPEAQEKAMEEWMNWFGSLGGSVVDAGSPFGPASTVASDGSVTQGGSNQLTGYSIIEADSLSAAAKSAKGCPVLSGGGSIEVYEALPIG
ncbi:MAG TPA: hypothetical protein VGY51_05875 [Acidimicrobiales bacterium]|jgi:hypothetical protein|nr:hypothetical protein [Acidimicrobiales bacterium]